MNGAGSVGCVIRNNLSEVIGAIVDGIGLDLSPLSVELWEMWCGFEILFGYRFR